jgi:rubrerythrin
MSTAELKLKLFREIDNLKDSELKKLYKLLHSLLNSSEKYILTTSEKKAVKEALEFSSKGETLSHESVMNEAKNKYSKLKFK